VYDVGLAELTHPVIEAFCARYPRVGVRVLDADFCKGIEPLLTGQYDVALLRAPTDLAELTVVPLFTDPATALVWHGHRAAGEESVDIADLFDEPWITLPPSTPAPWRDHWVCADRRRTDATIGGYGRTMTEITNGVAYQHFVGLTALSASRYGPHPSVRYLRARGVVPFRTAVAHTASAPSPLAVAFAEVARRVARRRLALVPFAEPVE
jgi:hypothetical protein